MINLNTDYIRRSIADSPAIYKRGVSIYENGVFSLREADQGNKAFVYDIDGNYGDYTIDISFQNGDVSASCDCPYPGSGCKHIVAALLDVRDILQRWQKVPDKSDDNEEKVETKWLMPEEIKSRAIEDRKNRAKNETFTITPGDMFKDEHLIESPNGKQYVVTLHDPVNAKGHCSCPDYLTNRLGTCKHLIHVADTLKGKRGFFKRVAEERFPFIDIFWDSFHNKPRVFIEKNGRSHRKLESAIYEYFDKDGLFKRKDLTEFMPLLSHVDGNKHARIQDAVLSRLDYALQEKQMQELSQRKDPVEIPLNEILYPYQKEGVRYCLYRRAALIGDEMGLGKTLQAISVSILKKEIFGFSKILIITPASLKEQWKREIERFTSETVTVIEGSPRARSDCYMLDKSSFKITNYEAVLRDITVIIRYKPDLMILDEAQRIKNFSTKTADAVKQIPRKHALVLTGTPLENKLEDIYSIIQFLDPYMLVPLWKFAAEYFMLSRDKRDKILGYHNLDTLHERLKSIVIRRKKEEVLSDLPEQIENNYYIDLHEKQVKMHNGYMQSLLPILNKKYLTPMDIRRMQVLLLRMRMVCNSTYLIDRKTHISPKLKELEGVLNELVIQDNRKMVIFSEWTTMTYLIARHLSDVGIPFVELSGKVPVKKRQLLIDEFTNNPSCKVFLSTDAGGTGLNLQAADCVVNFELPWNPAKKNQRIGRVNRIGQKSKCVNVVNLITKNSIEEKILTGIQLKMDLFNSVFDGTSDVVEFSQEKRTQLINQLREMIGEEPVLQPVTTRPAEDVPEDTPYYLNPKVMQESERELNVTGEEQVDTVTDQPSGDENMQNDSDGFSMADQAPEKIETVLNSGMQFIGGLLEMATGKKMASTEDSGRMVTIDKKTGEVTFKFKLPGF